MLSVNSANFRLGEIHEMSAVEIHLIDVVPGLGYEHDVNGVNYVSDVRVNLLDVESSVVPLHDVTGNHLNCPNLVLIRFVDFGCDAVESCPFPASFASNGMIRWNSEHFNVKYTIKTIWIVCILRCAIGCRSTWVSWRWCWWCARWTASEICTSN